MRRIAHYDYWQDKVRRSILADARADILLYGNAERALVELAYRLANGQTDRAVSPTFAALRSLVKDLPADWTVIDSTNVDKPGRVEQPLNPYAIIDESVCATSPNNDQAPSADIKLDGKLARVQQKAGETPEDRRTPAVVQRRQRDPVLYAHASRVLHLETNPGNARALVQNQGGQKIWFNPPPIPLTTEEMDYVFGFDYARVPHPSYGDARIPAYEMIRFSVNIMRGCFGGCTFCSITEHEGASSRTARRIRSCARSRQMRDKVPGFTGVISDLGGPTANMYRIACKSKAIETACRRPSCVYPGICENLNTDHSALIDLYRARAPSTASRKS